MTRRYSLTARIGSGTVSMTQGRDHYVEGAISEGQFQHTPLNVFSWYVARAAEHRGGEVDQGELDLRLNLAHLARQYAGAAASVEDFLAPGRITARRSLEHGLLPPAPATRSQFAKSVIAVSDTVIDGRDIVIRNPTEQLGVGEERCCALQASCAIRTATRAGLRSPRATDAGTCQLAARAGAATATSRTMPAPRSRSSGSSP